MNDITDKILTMGPYADFGIIDNFDKSRDYSEYKNGETYQDKVKEHNCVKITDNIINFWWNSLTAMKSYFHCFDRPATALARWGVTLIPPESLGVFYNIIENDTPVEFFDKYAEVVTRLLNLVERAKHENKFVIHYGV